jgi:hypothetical protein
MPERQAAVELEMGPVDHTAVYALMDEDGDSALPEDHHDKIRARFLFLSAIAGRQNQAAILQLTKFQVKLAMFKYHSIWYRYFYLFCCVMNLMAPLWQNPACEFSVRRPLLM